MSPTSTKRENRDAQPLRGAPGRFPFVAVALVFFLSLFAANAAAQEQLLFSNVDDGQTALLQKIWNETIRIDVSVWILGEREITDALIARKRAGVTVRVIGDRASIFETDIHTRREFEHLATNGVPVRLRYHPTWYPEIMHWKAGIFVGQGVVEFGSANWTTFELRPFSSTDFKEESVFFTDDDPIVNAFMTKFDQYWADTTYFMDWPEAYRLETGQTWPTPLPISRERLVQPDFETHFPDLIWGQGPEPMTVPASQADGRLNGRLIEEINRETRRIDFISYRTTVSEIIDALIARHQAGVQVRVLAEPTQYRNDKYPEYWMVGAMIDRLLVAGVPVKQRTRVNGLTHMKSLITSNTALVSSANFTRFWERDHSYFIPASTKGHLVARAQAWMDTVWADTRNYTNFQAQPPYAPVLVSPAGGAGEVSTLPRLEWRRAAFATSFDVWLGPANGQLALLGQVNAEISEDPPQTYGLTLTQALQPGTTYAWRVVSRTYTGLSSASDLRFFTTTGTGGGGGGGGGGSGSGPYQGVAVSLPGVIQAENFDEGPNGTAYSDTTAGNSGGVYRSTDVDIEATSDAGGGYNVGWTRPGEWLNYTVNVATAGTYTLEFRVASNNGTGAFRLDINGTDATGSIPMPGTGSWQSWITIRRDVTLAAGSQVWRLVMGASTGGIANFNYIRVVAASGGGGGGTPPASTPYNGTAVSLPGTIQAENFDEGGATIAYLDQTAGNTGGEYRSTNVDIASALDTGDGFTLGWVDAGEWLKYTVNVGAAGSYDIEVRVASWGAGGTFHIEVDGVDRTGPLTVPDTGGWQTWTTIRRTGVSLAAGQHVLRLVMDSVGPTGAVGNFNWIRVLTAGGGGSGGSSPSSPFSGTPMALPGTIQAENFDAGGATVAYFDQTAGNTGGQYRSTDVDIAGAVDTGGGYTLGWVDAGEWLNYSVNVGTAGLHDIEVRVASAGAGGTFHLEVNGQNVTGAMSVPNTNGWQTWMTIRRDRVNLAAGQQVWRLVMDTVGSTGAVGNFNWIRVTRSP